MTCKFDNGDECEALTEKNCEGCKFSKTATEFVRDSGKALTRILNLPKGKRAEIAEKYYSGRNE